MTRFLILTTASVFCLAAVCFLYRTDRLPPLVHRHIDMLSIFLAVFAATPISIAVWEWLSLVPQDALSGEMAAYVAFNAIVQFISIQLTRVAVGLPARNRS